MIDLSGIEEYLSEESLRRLDDPDLTLEDAALGMTVFERQAFYKFLIKSGFSHHEALATAFPDNYHDMVYTVRLVR